jgi:hypothetical protein
MKLFCKLIFFLTLLNFHLISAEQDLKSLVEQLGASNYQDREEATKTLWKMGQLAVEELRSAAKSSDPEIADRAKELLARIELGITPDTPKELVKTLQKFHDSNEQEKGKMLIELSREEKGWLTIRTLLLKDTNQNLAGIILSQVDLNLVLSLRDQGRHLDAGAILELSVVFNKDDSWINALTAFADQRNSQKEILKRLSQVSKLLDPKNIETKAIILQAQIRLHYSLKNYEDAALLSRQLYKMAFKEDSEKLKKICQPLFIDSHLMAEKYSYLEQFWDKTTLDFSKKRRLWNIMWLQRMQGKAQDYKTTKAEVIKLLSNKNDYITLTTTLLLNGEIDDAKKILIQFEDYEVLANLAKGSLDYPTYEKWLKKATAKDNDIQLEYLVFQKINKGQDSLKTDLLEEVEKRKELPKKLIAILYLHQAGFTKEANKYLRLFLEDASIDDNHALRAAWTLTGSRTLGELFVILRDKSKKKSPKDAIDLISLLALTEDSDSFIEYVKILEENFEGYSKVMRQITYALGQYCLDKEWNTSAAAVMAMLEPAQRGLFNSLLETEAHIRDKEYTKAVHNLLGPVGTPKLSLPYYLVAQAYTLNEETDKRQKALQFAYSYDVGRENINSMTTQYLYENGHYDFFLETAEKLCRVGSPMSPFRLRAYQQVSSSHIHNLKHEQAKPFFMTYYKLASSDLTLLQGGPTEAMRMAYQFYEFELRDAVKNNENEKIEPLADKCESLFYNNIEVPILLKDSKNKEAQKLHKKYFSRQWEHMLKAIEELPNHAILLNSAAWLGALNDFELQKCLKMVQKAIDLDPSAANYDTKAEVEYRLKLYKEALKSIEKAASLDKLEPFFRERVVKFRQAAQAAK